MNARFALRLLAAALIGLAARGAPAAAEPVSVCFNYGCVAQADVLFDDGQLAELESLLGRAQTPAEEREAIGEAVGRLLGWAGRQSSIGADRGGNYADDAVYGRMDCIDHATTTTRLLRLLERRGLLRFHSVLEPATRLRFLFFPHYSAQIEESGGAKSGEENASARFVVDSWFFDNGHPAAVMPLDAWLTGESPDDGA
ncbi:MAG: hypothetical protein LBD06_09670 [Candidatus Accumulibacter sp.]|nr:hypothetical protein [Accumulibacter sp.]